MRIFAALLLLFASSAAGAASSFVTLPAIETQLSRSMVMLGGEKPAVAAVQPPAESASSSIVRVERDEPVTISASVVAFGKPAPAKTVVAESKHEAEHLPTVMRGGLLGEAQLRTTAAEAPAATAPVASRGSSRQAPVRDTPPEPATPPAAAPPPTRQPE